MENQEQIIDQTEASAEVVADVQATEVATEVVNVEPAIETHEDSLLSSLGCLATAARTRAPEGQEFPYNAFYQDGTVHYRAVTPATEASAEAVAEQAPHDEAISVKKQGKGRRNQNKRQAPPQVGQWLNANFERRTERGIIVRRGKARFHVDFRDMALAEDGTSIRFQDGDKVRVRVLSLDRQGGLPQATMLGKMLRPAPVNRPATEAQAEAEPVD